MSRGDRRESIFLNDSDRQMFLLTLEQTVGKADWQVHAFCLMRNHFHLVVETPRANLVAGMQWLLGTYTARFNRRHRYCGHLFSGRYKALIVDGSGTGYLKRVCDYVHLNPSRAHLLQLEEPLADYRWSSWPEYLKGPGKRLGWLRADRVMGEWGIEQDNASGRRRLEYQMEQRRREELDRLPTQWQEMRQGWCLGSQTFREKMLELVGSRKGAQHAGTELKESDEQKAERLLAALFRQAGWSEGELRLRRKGDITKARMAARLRAETTMTWSWIAERLGMGHWRTAANAARGTFANERIRKAYR